MEFSVQDPIFLWFLVSIPILISLHFFSLRFSRRRAIKFANFEAIKRVGTGLYSGSVLSKNIVILIIRLLTLTSVILALAGLIAYTMDDEITRVTIALDASGSMLASDIEPTRIQAAKQTAIDFVQSLSSTKTGIIAFSGVSKIQSKPTRLKDRTLQAIRDISIQSASGTAIGDAIVAATNLQDQSTIILITDGQSTVGSSVADAINYAQERKVTIHTIGVATPEGDTVSGLLSTIDAESLKEIAESTGGNFYEAFDRQGLEQAYAEITENTEHRRAHEMRFPLLMAAIGLLFLEWILVNLRYRTIP
ncbi:MAG: vWA domain-containing protein [Nanobdellota archaeon]